MLPIGGFFMLTCHNDVLTITKQLVNIESIVNTSGETDMANFIYNWLKQLPYFQANSSSIVLEKTVDDDKQRYNVLAYIKGTKRVSNKTVMLMGHVDTVGIDDFGQIKDAACSPDDLVEEMLTEAVPSMVEEHLKSGDWMFGRGSLDMKSGLASHLYLIKYYSENPDKLEGNIVFVAECDEEDGSHGILSALKTLRKWKKEQNFEYIAAINADFVSPRYEGDENRYIYKGTVGKLLPSFFITGAETHVGSCFEGIDPNFIASYLTKQISYNPDLCNEAYGERTVPPVSLKQTDLKPTYTVQTALSTYVYYNFFIHSWSPKDVLDLLKEQATIAFSDALVDFKKSYQTYSETTGEPIREVAWQPRVFIYEEMVEKLVEKFGDEYESAMNTFKEKLLEDSSLDTRMYSARVVEEAWKWMEDKSPAIILFYSSLYSPRIEVTGKDENEQNLLQALDNAVQFVQPHYEHPIVTRNFFPYISDMSFVALSDDEQGIEAVSRNNPSWGKKHFINYDDIRAINVPVINIGPYGFDAHKKYERAELNFSHYIVPNLTNEVIKKLIG